jgi:hypothetical protein
MHRLMMTSATYRQASGVTAIHQDIDSENALFSRMPMRRVDAEVLYDTMLLVAGRLDETRFGPPDPVEVNKEGLVTPVATSKGWRRSIYVEQRRKRIPTLLENFDLPQMNPHCLERMDSNVAPQALHLLNNGMVHRLAQGFAQRVLEAVGTDPSQQIERVYLIALSRPPSDDEREISRATLVQLTAHWARQHGDSAEHGGSGSNDAPLRALTSFCHTILNSAEFLYVD